MVNPHVQGTPTVIWETLPWYNLGAAIQLGVQGGTNCMAYDLQVLSSDFPGEAKITQLCTLNSTGLGGSYTGALDGSDPYNPLGIDGDACDVLIFTNPATGQNTLYLNDAPDAKVVTLPSGISIAQLDDSFDDYVMFKPSGDGIFVPLAMVTWDVSASVTSPSTNITQTVHGPTGPADSDGFPIWTTTRIKENTCDLLYFISIFCDTCNAIICGRNFGNNQWRLFGHCSSKRCYTNYK